MSSESLVEFLSSVEFCSAFARPELEELAAAAEGRVYDFGAGILAAGEPGQGCYVIRSGKVRLLAESHGKETSVGIRGERDVIGEISGISSHVNEYSARASSRTEILFLPRSAVLAVLARNENARRFVTRYAALRVAGGFVARLFDLGAKVDHAELAELVRSVGAKRAKAGRVILAQGSAEDRRLYFVRTGEVRITRQEEGVEYTLAVIRQGGMFGEQACLLSQGQYASAIAVTDAVLLVVPEVTVRILGEKNPRLHALMEERIRFAERELERQRALAERRKRGVLLDLGGRRRRGENVIQRFALEEQAEETDCGAACLAMVCRHHRITISLGKLREMANVTTEGATLESLARAAESLGFVARGVKCTYPSILGFDLPFIAHWEGYHYVVVYGLSKNHAWIADPAVGFRKLTVSEFERGWTGTCLMVTPGPGLVQVVEGRSPWVRFVAYLRPYKKLLVQILLATLLVDLLAVVPPVVIQNILDRVVAHQNMSLLFVLMTGLVITHAFVLATSTLRAYLTSFMMRSLDFAMMSDFCRHTVSLPLAFFTKRKTGDIMARFQENHTIRAFMTQSTLSTLLNVLMVLVYFPVMFYYNAKLTLLLIAFMPPVLILTALATPRIKNYARRSFDASADEESFLMEALSGMETVKGMGIERAVRLKWEKKYVKLLDIQYRSSIFESLVGVAGEALNVATTVVLLWIGASLVVENRLTVGQLMAFSALMGNAMTPLMGLVGLWDELQEVGVAMERLGDVLDIEPEQKPGEIDTRIVLPALRGDLRVQNVCFRYGGKETPYVLENISLKIDAGTTVALVGRSGSGKTTLAKLLVGFYRPTEGSIFVDDYDLGLIDLERYRAQIGYVMQNNLLFSGTIAENIAIGDPNPDRRRIVDVAKLVDAHNFISGMALGYEQVVGERGLDLSGGQRQRICIARALYHDPRLLVLDEATSALDTEAEENILTNLRGILQGRTALVIAHRLSTVMSADRILVLYDGSIVEEGTHHELLAKKGMYFHLVEKQIGGAS